MSVTLWRALLFYVNWAVGYLLLELGLKAWKEREYLATGAVGPQVGPLPEEAVLTLVALTLVALWVAYSLSVRRLDALKWPLALVGVLVGVLWLRRRLRIFG